MLTTTLAVGALVHYLSCSVVKEASRGAICGVRLVRLAFFDVQALSELRWRRHHGSFANQVWRPTDLAAGRRIYISTGNCSRNGRYLWMRGEERQLAG